MFRKILDLILRRAPAEDATLEARYEALAQRMTAPRPAARAVSPFRASTGRAAA